MKGNSAIRRAGDSNFGTNLFGIFAVKDFRVRNDQPPASQKVTSYPHFSDRLSPLPSHGEQAVAFAAHSLIQWVAVMM